MEQNPYAPPEARELTTDENSLEYAGYLDTGCCVHY